MGFIDSVVNATRKNITSLGGNVPSQNSDDRWQDPVTKIWYASYGNPFNQQKTLVQWDDTKNSWVPAGGGGDLSSLLGGGGGSSGGGGGGRRRWDDINRPLLRH